MCSAAVCSLASLMGFSTIGTCCQTTGNSTSRSINLGEYDHSKDRDGWSAVMCSHFQTHRNAMKFSVELCLPNSKAAHQAVQAPETVSSPCQGHLDLNGSERESVKCPIWRGLERLRLAAEQRFARQPLFSEPQIQRWRPGGGGHFTHAAEIGKNPRIPLIVVGLAHLQGSLPEALEEPGFLTAFSGSEGAYQPRPQESHGRRMGKTDQFPVV